MTIPDPIPPISRAGSRSSADTAVPSAWITRMTAAVARATATDPICNTPRPILVAIESENAAPTKVPAANGRIVIPACSADHPRPICRYSESTNRNPMKPAKYTRLTAVPAAKDRFANSDRFTSGLVPIADTGAMMGP
jgi:hypothetical protein